MSIDELESRVDTVVAHLPRQKWPPITVMLVPSLLSAADGLVGELTDYEGPGRDRADALAAKVRQLRALCCCSGGRLPN